MQFLTALSPGTGAHQLEPVGFRWFVDGLMENTLAFAGEECAGASLLRRDGSVWTTDKDGLVLGLLAAEIVARTGRDPGELYRDLATELGGSFYERIDAPANSEQMALLKTVGARQLEVAQLGSEPVLAIATSAPGSGAALGGVRVTAANSWFAARPSDTENVYKIYAESFVGTDHLRHIQRDAQTAIGGLIGASVVAN